jgi:hypothetical protein
MSERIGAAKIRAAVRAGIHLFGVRCAARGAKAERARLPMNDSRSGGTHLAQDELLRPDANAIAIGELLFAFDGNAIDPASVAAPEVLENRVIVIDVNPGMPPRDRGIEDGDVTIVTSTNQGVARREIEFLEKKTKSISRWTALARVAHSVATLASPPESRCDIRRSYGRLIDFRTDAFTAHSYAAVLVFQGVTAKTVQRGRAKRRHAGAPSAPVHVREDGIPPVGQRRNASSNLHAAWQDPAREVLAKISQ